MKLLQLLTITFILGFTASVKAQNAYFYILVKQHKVKSWCTKDVGFRTHTLHPKMDSEKRNKVIEVFKKRLSDNTASEKVKTIDFSITNKDYVVIYEYEFKNDDCPSKTTTSIKAFKTSNADKIQEIFQKKIQTSFVADKILSSKIIYQEKPLESVDSNSLFKDVESYIRNNTRTDKNKKTKKSDAIGVRG